MIWYLEDFAYWLKKKIDLLRKTIVEDYEHCLKYYPNISEVKNAKDFVENFAQIKVDLVSDHTIIVNDE